MASKVQIWKRLTDIKFEYISTAVLVNISFQNLRNMEENDH